MSTIIEVAEEIASGDYADQFPVDVFQTGSGHLDEHEPERGDRQVASERLGRRIGPNDEVNTAQSSNDTFPSASTSRRPSASPMASSRHWSISQATLRSKATEFADVVKSGAPTSWTQRR